MGQTDKREAVLQAATEVFANKGFNNATVGEIAQRAGVAKGTPYLYFADKTGIFCAVFDRWCYAIFDTAAEALSVEASASERLLALGLTSVDYMEAHEEWFPLTLEVWSATATPALRPRFAQAFSNLYAAYRQQVAAIIREGQDHGELRRELDADSVAALLVGAVDGLLLQHWFDPALDARACLRDFVTAFLHGALSSQRKE